MRRPSETDQLPLNWDNIEAVADIYHNADDRDFLAGLPPAAPPPEARREFSWMTLLGAVLLVAGTAAALHLESKSRREEETLLEQTLARPDTAEGGVRAIAFAPNGQVIAGGSGDGTVRLWSPASGSLLSSLTGHQCGIHKIAFAPDGRTLASAAGYWPHDAGELFLWNALDGQLVRRLWEHTHPVTALAFSPNGRLLAASHATKPDVEGHGQIVLWDTATWNEVMHLDDNEEVAALAFSPDGQFLVAGGSSPLVHVWHLPTHQVRHVLKGHQYGVWSLAISPDSRTLATVASGGIVRLFSLTTGHLLRRLPFAGMDGQARTAAFSPDGRILALGIGTRRGASHVLLWNVAAQHEIATLAGHSDLIYDVAFAPDGRLLASGGADSTVRLWNVAQCYEERVFSVGEQ